MNKLIIISFLIFAGCSFNKPKLDFKNEETTKQSLKEINKQLDFIEQEKLKESMMLILFDGINNFDDFMKFKFDQKYYSKLKNQIDGKTYYEIVNTAKSVADKNIKILEKEKLEDKPNRDFIEQFKIIDYSIYSNFENKVINIKIQNNSIDGLYAFTLYIKSKSPENSIPQDELIIDLQLNETLWGKKDTIVQIELDKNFNDNVDFRILKAQGTTFDVQSKWSPEKENKLNYYKDFIGKQK